MNCYQPTNQDNKMPKRSRKTNNTDLSDRSDQLDYPPEWDDYPLYKGEWGDISPLPLDPEVDTHYWGFWKVASLDSDAKPDDRDDDPESLRCAPEHSMQEEDHHVDKDRFSDVCSELQVAETKIQELQLKLNEALEKNADMMKEKEQQDKKYSELECKLQEMEKKK